MGSEYVFTKKRTLTPFSRGLSIEVRRQLPEKGKLSVLQSELYKLADVLDEFAERMS